EKCCSDCAPGERMRSRCTASADTVCSPCQDGYFSSQHHHGFCQSCTICNTRVNGDQQFPWEELGAGIPLGRGELGLMPAGIPLGIPLGSKCSRCPEGTFSRGGNKNCQPWTNCSSFGKSTLRAGTSTEDAQC
ncbi:TNR4 factor, partial [Peucedramus taeniatus]|nr:TNR4 factor [Peucedramus taeniatus]